MEHFLKSLHLSVSGFLHYLPSLIGGIVCFIFTVLLANFLSRLSSRYSLRRTKDGLISHFIGKIVWAVFFILGTVLALGILGLGTISNKILAGAGITTFVIGFALKDIGENFLAGLVLAFSRPYKVGSLIECGEVKGVVQNMTLRQTTIESDEGKIVLVPNSMIINNPLSKYFMDNDVSQEFSISVDAEQVHPVAKLIKETVSKFEVVLSEGGKEPKVIADALSGDKIRLNVIFWLDVSKLKGSRMEARSTVLLAVFDALHQKSYKFSG